MEPDDSPSRAEERRDRELRYLRARRYADARDAGFSDLEAQLYASSDIASSDLRDLIAAGCPEKLRAAILL